jgi:3-deoxy-D-manno-octulosonic-acid transferase
MWWLSLTIYNLLLPLWLLLMLPAALLKMQRRGGRWRDLTQRFTLWSVEQQTQVEELPAEERYWVHAVSVGEVGIARKFIQALLIERPAASVILTTTTPTGYTLAQEAQQTTPGRLVALYSPLDLTFTAKRALSFFQPKRILLIEAEVWPNLMQAARAAAVPVSLLNARLSPKSERRYRAMRFWVKPLFSLLDQVGVPVESDVARWTGLGVVPQRIHITGSIKFDPQGAAPAQQQVQLVGKLLHQAGMTLRPLLLAASTHAGEELALTQSYQELRTQWPHLGLLLVPRHFERGTAIQAELAALGITTQLRSSAELHAPCDVLIVDSTGELKAWQAWATVVIIGKSFLAEGGQNPAEAILAGKPVICGPHMENFADLIDTLQAAQAVQVVPELKELPAVTDTLLRNPSDGTAMAERGQQVLAQHNGATQRSVRLVCMPPSSP